MAQVLLAGSLEPSDAPTLASALSQVEESLRVWASSAELFQSLLQQVFGVGAGVAADALRSELLAGGLGLQLERLDSTTLAGRRGAYTSDGADGGERIYINDAWLNTATTQEITAVLIEEIGHALDQRLHGLQDTPGDEGALFAALLLQQPLSEQQRLSIQTEDDHGTLQINGQTVLVEAAEAIGTGLSPNPNAGVIDIGPGEFQENNEDFTNEGTINNSGTLENYGTLFNNGPSFSSIAIVLNEGLIANSGTITNTSYGEIVNRGTFLNRSESFLTNDGGFINNSGTIDNSGTLLNNGFSFLFNGGLLENDKSIVNDGSLENANQLNNNNGGDIVNNNFLRNNGALNNDGLLEHIDGIFDNNGQISNNGTFNNSAFLDNSTFGEILNNGNIFNQGFIQNIGITRNDSYFYNGDAFVNFGYLSSLGQFRNLGTLDNNASVTIEGFFDNLGTLFNIGTFENNGQFFNDGPFLTDSTSILMGRGDFYGDFNIESGEFRANRGARIFDNFQVSGSGVFRIEDYSTSDSILTLFGSGSIDLEFATIDYGSIDSLTFGSYVLIDAENAGSIFIDLDQQNILLDALESSGREYNLFKFQDEDLVLEVTCLLAGTLIATPSGEQPIETLQPGDWVQTVNGPRAVRFLSRTSHNPVILWNLDELPIRINAGALGGGSPRRDLYVSSDHGILIEGHLVQASALVNDRTICRTTPEDWSPHRPITYYKLEFQEHELITAEGLLVESFVDNQARGAWDNHQHYLALYGEELPIREMPLPRIKYARQLSGMLRSHLQQLLAPATVALETPSLSRS
ncbi:Hint domain-containing protein [Cyanobium gracile UHCC 0139]|uniref:Hint domain-containing protein n=1 Tax=Cyanobium gracile UHCC 0139 TaxID=3110308 RepID=A0ABU5RWX1_9CYAN|nr:Hint domain-containing protein [Cyanobium gracile]MEA5392273.1 Hint domain-containing protein [Cyanobium gracile UHCC 0139]